MYSKEDYLKMLRERDKHHIDSKEWSFCQSKVMCIASIGILDCHEVSGVR